MGYTTPDLKVQKLSFYSTCLICSRTVLASAFPNLLYLLFSHRCCCFWGWLCRVADKAIGWCSDTWNWKLSRKNDVIWKVHRFSQTIKFKFSQLKYFSFQKTWTLNIDNQKTERTFKENQKNSIIFMGNHQERKKNQTKKRCCEKWDPNCKNSRWKIDILRIGWVRCNLRERC